MAANLVPDRFYSLQELFDALTPPDLPHEERIKSFKNTLEALGKEGWEICEHNIFETPDPSNFTSEEEFNEACKSRTPKLDGVDYSKTTYDFTRYCDVCRLKISQLEKDVLFTCQTCNKTFDNCKACQARDSSKSKCPVGFGCNQIKIERKETEKISGITICLVTA